MADNIIRVKGDGAYTIDWQGDGNQTYIEFRLERPVEVVRDKLLKTLLASSNLDLDGILRGLAITTSMGIKEEYWTIEAAVSLMNSGELNITEIVSSLQEKTNEVDPLIVDGRFLIGMINEVNPDFVEQFFMHNPFLLLDM